MVSRCIPVIGILGGIGSGKSSVISRSEGFKLEIIDADRIGHELLQHPQIQDCIRQQFGDAVFTGVTRIDRALLAQRVFGPTDNHKAALEHLNQIMHPAIRQVIQEKIDTVPADADAVILDAALLLEGGWEATCDWLVFIETPQELREQRVLENRNWSADELARREATQWSLSDKKSRADFVIDNSGSLESATAEMNDVLRTILTKHSPNQSLE